MKYLLITVSLVLSLCLAGCSTCLNDDCFSLPALQLSPPELTPEEIAEAESIPVVPCEEVTAVVQDFAVELKYEKRLTLENAQTYFNGGIHTIQISFRTQRLVDMCDGRELIVDIVEGLLAKLNQDIILGPAFSDFPFTANNLEVYIDFESFYGEYVDPYYLWWIGLEDGDVLYETFSLKDNNKNCWSSRREAYSKSREIVVYQRQAEEKYRENHPTKRDIFGGRRFYTEP